MRCHAQPLCSMTLRGKCKLPGCEIGCDHLLWVTAGTGTLRQVEVPCEGHGVQALRVPGKGVHMM